MGVGCDTLVMIHSAMGVTPFEAAHRLPTASTISRMVTEGDYCAPDTMNEEGITAMQTTVKVLSQIIKQQQQ